MRRRFEAEDERDACEHEPPIHQWHVDLPFGFARGVAYRDAREVTELDGLVRERKNTADERLRSDDGAGHGRQAYEQVGGGAPRYHGEKRIGNALRLAQYERALPQIRGGLWREDQEKPRKAGWAARQVAHVRIEVPSPPHLRREDGDAQDEGGLETP